MGYLARINKGSKEQQMQLAAKYIAECESLMKSDKIKSMKARDVLGKEDEMKFPSMDADESDDADYDEPPNMAAGEAISFDHVLALFLFCQCDEFRIEFRNTFVR